MLYYLTAAGLIAHAFFWGVGLAWLATPREWRRWSWVFAPACGWALQSAVVWAGTHTSVAGTDGYARASELLPLLLLGVSIRRRRAGWPRGWIAVVPVALVAAWLFLSPLTVPGRGLTTSSLGSCDQADYAAGARVFQEFSKDDRTGFLGLPEVTRVRSTDYFFDFWLRLNHFTPSALLAHNASVFGVESYRLVSVTAAVLVLLNLPIVLFLARALVGVRGPLLAGVAALYAWSPLNAYAVHHGALGQLYAAQGIAVLTLAIVGSARARPTGGPAWRFLPLMVVAVWLLAGSYNFILLVCLAPAAAWLFMRCVVRREMAPFLRVATPLVVAVVACAVVFWGRFAGLVERFSLFEQYNFGWVVPLASPEGWLGILRDTSLHAWPGPVRVILAALVVVLYFLGVVHLWRRPRDRALAALALVLPVVAGWGMLAWETRERANASYDAYKILAVFLPGLLAGLACWLAVLRRGLAAILLAAVLGANLVLGAQFRRSMQNPLLRVDRRLAALAQLEQEARVTSLNMTIADFWSRLWANAFLLRKAQYFPTHTYEGRLNTALKGEWDLEDTLLRAVPFDPADRIVVNELFQVVKVAAPGRLRATFAGGWHAGEKDGANRWRWAKGEAMIAVVNSSGQPVRARLALGVRGFRAGTLELKLAGKPAGTRPLDGTPQSVVFEDLTFPPGETTLTLAGPPGVAPGGGDARLLSFALDAFELRGVRVESPQNTSP